MRKEKLFICTVKRPKKDEKKTETRPRKKKDPRGEER